MLPPFFARDQSALLPVPYRPQFVDEKGVDKGLAIREKSKRLVEWASDPSPPRDSAETRPFISRGLGSARVSSPTPT